jgi:hypothetical protein
MSSSAQRTARLPPEQRAMLRLLGGPAPVPNLSRPSGRPEKRRRQVLLAAQDGLAETAAWTREIFTRGSLAKAERASTDGEKSIDAMRAKLQDWTSRGEAALTAEEQEHAAAVNQVQAGAAQLAADLSRLKKAGASGGGDAVLDAKRAREAAFPEVRLMNAEAPIWPARPKHGSSTAKKAPTSGGAITL